MLDELRDDHATLDILLDLSIKVADEYPIGKPNDVLGTLIIQALGHAAKHVRREFVSFSAMYILWKERANNDECIVGQSKEI